MCYKLVVFRCMYMYLIVRIRQYLQLTIIHGSKVIAIQTLSIKVTFSVVTV